MKKSLIALAVLAASGASFAQSSVTLYGLVDAWVGSAKVETSGVNLGSASVRQNNVDSGGFNTTRWGLKGSEDLGGGLKANFKLEQGFSLDTGAAGTGTATGGTQAFDRQTWVGFSGGFGEVEVGRVWSSYDDINSSAIDSFGANVAAKYNVWLGYQDRPQNAIKYITPTMSGFSGSLTYGLGEDKATNVSASRVAALGAQYSAGPLFVGLAYQQQTQTRGTNAVFNALPGVLTSGQFAAIAGLPANFATSLNGKTTYAQVNGSYDFAVAKLSAAYNVVKQTDSGVFGDFKAKEYDLGVDVPLSPSMTLAAGYARSKVDDAFKTTGYTAALKYSLTKRTFVYGVLSQTKLDVDGTNDEAKSSLYAVGVNHSF